MGGDYSPPLFYSTKAFLFHSLSVHPHTKFVRAIGNGGAQRTLA